MSYEMWPKQEFGGDRTIVTAIVKEVDQRYRVLFHDSHGNQLTVQIPDTALRTLVETGMTLLGLALKAKAQRGKTRR